jgi:alpha-tubulin suppressor-like RCC1 family protein
MGDHHTLVAAEDGSVYGFGLSSRLGLGTASHESQLTPKRIPNLKVRLG